MLEDTTSEAVAGSEATALYLHGKRGLFSSRSINQLLQMFLMRNQRCVTASMDTGHNQTAPSSVPDLWYTYLHCCVVASSPWARPSHPPPSPIQAQEIELTPARASTAAHSRRSVSLPSQDPRQNRRQKWKASGIKRNLDAQRNKRKSFWADQRK